jgi:hypothetical protein
MSQLLFDTLVKKKRKEHDSWSRRFARQALHRGLRRICLPSIAPLILSLFSTDQSLLSRLSPLLRHRVSVTLVTSVCVVVHHQLSLSDVVS